jgi:hypothetical protein
VDGFEIIKPTHEPQVKKGEQPEHSLSFSGALLVALLAVFCIWQSLSVQQGFAERIST